MKIYNYFRLIIILYVPSGRVGLHRTRPNSHTWDAKIEQNDATAYWLHVPTSGIFMLLDIYENEITWISSRVADDYLSKYFVDIVITCVCVK